MITPIAASGGIHPDFHPNSPTTATKRDIPTSPSNGDVYTNVVHNGILCTYIIDLGLDNTLGDDIEKYNIEHILKSKESLSEVVYYNYGKLYNDEIYEVLIFNEHYNIHFYIMDEEHNNHCSTHSATFKYKLKIGNFIIVDEEYYIHGKKCSEIEHSRVQKMRKIKQTMLKRI